MAEVSGRYEYTSGSLMSLTGGYAYNDPNFHLHLVEKKDLPTERPLIESTKQQRLSFYRLYTCTAAKTEIVPRQSVNINSFLWYYTIDIFFKSIPHSFVHFFLSSYAPEEHMFVTKMVPFSIGLKYLFTLVGFLEIITNLDLCNKLMHYTIAGIFQKNPWNRCPEPQVYFDSKLNATVRCMLLPEFARMFDNTSYEYLDFTFIYQKHYHFQVSQIEYYRHKMEHIENSANVIVTFLALWTAITFTHTQVSRQYFWQLVHYCQWTSIILEVLIMVYVHLVEYGSRQEVRVAEIVNPAEAHGRFTYPDIEMLAESITAPSIVHVLTSRSSQEIDPSRDSATMVTSNALIFIFRGLLSSSVQGYIEQICRTEIPITKFNHHTMLFFWNIFWTPFYLGDIYGSVFTLIQFLNEYLLIVVVYECVVECIIYEWKFLRRYIVMAVFGVAGVLVTFYTSVDDRIVLWIYGKSIATMAETVCIYVLYPVGRLVDDFTFHYGVAPTTLRILSMRLVPVFYAFKLYVMLSYVWTEMAETGVVKHYTWSWALMILPILLGNAFIAYRYLVKYRMTWAYIFRPLPKWGPREFSIRQLRKQFDSRYYIGSEVPRLLSRYLMSKRESKVYKVDVRYDFYRRSTVTGAMAVRFGGGAK